MKKAAACVLHASICAFFFSFFAPPSYLTSPVVLSALVLTLSCYLASFLYLIYFVFLSPVPFVLAVVVFPDTAVSLHPVVVVAAEEAVDLRCCH